jgi:uncharacterized protein YhdP
MAATKKKGGGGITSEAGARAALVEHRSLKAEAERLMVEHGITEKLEQAEALKKAATVWAVKHEKEVLNLDGGVYYRLRRDKYGGQWIATDDDLTADMPGNAMSMRRILRLKFPNEEKRRDIWNRITRRVVDPEKLKRVIAEGELTAEDVAPAFVEKEKSPFLIGYGG